LKNWSKISLFRAVAVIQKIMMLRHLRVLKLNLPLTSTFPIALVAGGMFISVLEQAFGQYGDD